MKRQRGFGYLEIVIVLAIAGAVAGALWWTYAEGKDAGRAAVKLEWAEANREQRALEARKIGDAAKGREEDRARTKVIYSTITQTVDRIVDRPVYRNVCFDADGLRCVNAAIRGEDAAGCKPADGVPGALAPAGHRREDRSS